MAGWMGGQSTVILEIFITDVTCNSVNPSKSKKINSLLNFFTNINCFNLCVCLYVYIMYETKM